MYMNDTRTEHLGWIEVALRATNPDLPNLRITAQSHYGPPNRIAFVVIFGIDGDRDRRRQIRAEACVFLQRLGYDVEMEPGRDIYDVAPIRPVSAHDEIRMLQCLRMACEKAGEKS